MTEVRQKVNCSCDACVAFFCRSGLKEATQASQLHCDQLGPMCYSSSGAQENMSPLVVENATKKFRQGDRVVDALAGVSFEVQQGQFVAVMGASGSGKSTLLHLMAGLARP